MQAAAIEGSQKASYKIGEVARLVGVQTHVLRYWEKEIDSVKPRKSASNQRRYTFRDIEKFKEIYRLLHQERYTLAGVKKRFSQGIILEENDVHQALTEEKHERLRLGLQKILDIVT
jgi:DNA-binding transcriptional MerR regulator